MATEALDLPRGYGVAVRLPHRLRVLLRAMRIARNSRPGKLRRHLAGRDERMMRDLAVNPTPGGNQTWLAAMLLKAGRA